MNRNTRIAIGLLVPSLLASIIVISTYSYIQALESINSMVVVIMLLFIVSAVASSAFTAYFFKGLTFKNKWDLVLVHLNTYPWIIFLILSGAHFWILAFPLSITPTLGYWFGKRYFSL